MFNKEKDDHRSKSYCDPILNSYLWVRTLYYIGSILTFGFDF